MKNKEELEKKTGVKHFDICIQNPPYSGTLHLKFLRNVLKITDKVVNISPARWLMDPFAKDKRSTLKTYEDVAKQITDLEVLDGKNTTGFDIKIYSNLGIYMFDKNNDNKFDYKNFWKTQKSSIEISIIEKVCYSNKCKYLNDVIENNKRRGIRVMICHIGGNRGTLPVYKDIIFTDDGFVNGKDWTKCKNMGGYTKPENALIPNSIKFNTTKEAENFWHSYKDLKFFKVLCDITIQQQNIQLHKLPFLNDYKHKITNEECYKLFELSNEEIEFIENY